MRNIKAFSRFILLIDDADMLDANSVNLLTQLCVRQYDKFKVFVTATSPKISLRNDNQEERTVSDAVIKGDETSGPLISPLVKDRRLSGIRRNQTAGSLQFYLLRMKAQSWVMINIRIAKVLTTHAAQLHKC